MNFSDFTPEDSNAIDSIKDWDQFEEDTRILDGITFSEKYGIVKSKARIYILNHTYFENEKRQGRTITRPNDVFHKRTIAISDDTYEKLLDAADILHDETGALKRACMDFIIRKGLDNISFPWEPEEKDCERIIEIEDGHKKITT
ncbi:MAG: hypothetical protein K6F77_09735 [Lachnospiraceae bacterium]|nr:hypothetical protein [Lachnospiraceae bacterium]